MKKDQNNEQLKILLLGIQGAGKSTQGNLLRDALGIPYLSTGHIFREMAKEKTPLGRYIKETINSGVLVPDKKTLEIVEDYLSRPEYRNGYIMDGFPRTVAQAKAFKNGINKAFYLKVPDREALWRLAYRDPGERQDETLQAILKRIDMYHKFTDPVIEYYRNKGILVEVDGERSIEEIHTYILKNIKKS